MHGSTCSTPSRLLRVTLHLLLVHADNLRHLSLFRVFLRFSALRTASAEPVGHPPSPASYSWQIEAP